VDLPTQTLDEGADSNSHDISLSLVGSDNLLASRFFVNPS